MRPLLILFFLLLPATAAPWAEKWSFPTKPHLPLTITTDRSGTLYLAQKGGGLIIMREFAGLPKILATIPVRDFGGLDVSSLTIHNSKLYLALGGFFGPGEKAGLAIVDISHPQKPKILSTWTSPNPQHGASTVLVHGRHAFLSAMGSGVMIFDISNPTAIRHLTTYQPDIHFPRKNPNRIQHPNARHCAVKGKHLFLSYDAGGLRVIDISNPTKPHEIGRYVNPGLKHKAQAYNTLLLDGNIAYAAIDYAGLEVLDISNPAAIKQLAWLNPWKAHTPANRWFNSPGHTNQIALDQKQKTLFLSAGDSELLAVNVSRPRTPTLLKQLGTPKNGRGTWGVHLTANHIYLTDITTVIPFRGTWSGLRCLAR